MSKRYDIVKSVIDEKTYPNKYNTPLEPEKGDTVTISTKNPQVKKFNGKKGKVVSIDGNFVTVKVKGSPSGGVEFLKKELTVESRLNEVKVMHDRYERSHGKKASGKAAWAFTTKRMGSPSDDEIVFISGPKTLSQAAKEAGEKLGTKSVYVMEAQEVNEAIDQQEEFQQWIKMSKAFGISPLKVVFFSKKRVKTDSIRHASSKVLKSKGMYLYTTDVPKMLQLTKGDYEKFAKEVGAEYYVVKQISGEFIASEPGKDSYKLTYWKLSGNVTEAKLSYDQFMAASPQRKYKYKWFVKGMRGRNVFSRTYYSNEKSDKEALADIKKNNSRDLKGVTINSIEFGGDNKSYKKESS